MTTDGPTVSFTWKTGIPMPMDPGWDKASIALEKMTDRFNRHRLTVRGLPAAQYS